MRSVGCDGPGPGAKVECNAKSQSPMNTYSTPMTPTQRLLNLIQLAGVADEVHCLCHQRQIGVLDEKVSWEFIDTPSNLTLARPSGLRSLHSACSLLLD